MCKCLAFLFWYLSIWFRTITLVSHNDFGNVFWLCIINLFDPVFQTMKSFPISDGVKQYNPSSSLIIGLSNSFKTLLTSRIPDLHFKFGSSNANSFDFKIDTYCCDMCHFVLFVDIAEKDISLTDRSITNDDYLY